MIPADQNIEFCCDECAKNDYPFYLQTLFQAADKRAGLWILGALRLQLENIAATVKQPTLGFMRLTFWRDEVAKLGAGQVRTGQPVLEALAQLVPRDLSVDDLHAYINAFEPVIEGEAGAHAEIFSALVEKILGNEKAFLRYCKQQTLLKRLHEKHRGSKWQDHPPFLALRLWLAR